MRCALFVTVAVLVTLLVSHCAGRPWQQQRQQQRHKRQRRPRPAAAYEPSTAVAPSYAVYDDPPVAVDDPYPSSSLSPEQSLLQQGPLEPDYGDPGRLYVEPERVYAEPEQNYEVDEAVSVLSDGRVHGVQLQQVPMTTTSPRSITTTTPIVTTTTAATSVSTSCTTSATVAVAAAETRKSGYVLDSKHYRKYRVEEETPDGFIVGEYGVVSHHDGTTRGVRYTADSSINPRVIYEALAKFLALKRRR
ncbi:uncharacterized protein LOC112689677 [Sipha flava]|uniref:Uncharacterized protein LOC112689677 n=1 Tax=Sipha flava TaxID=143950 RepID=A0A2S2PYI6_9HEMI|nr:uncharacterized protein LOC112689677 [Sipha flava]